MSWREKLRSAVTGVAQKNVDPEFSSQEANVDKMSLVSDWFKVHEAEIGKGYLTIEAWMPQSLRLYISKKNRELLDPKEETGSYHPFMYVPYPDAPQQTPVEKAKRIVSPKIHVFASDTLRVFRDE